MPIKADENDSGAVTLGVRFQTDRSGYITGIRFYKSAANTGVHVGGLWTLDGTLLGSVTFTNESASGWQQATFASPIPITAGTIYVASYFAPQGHYAEDNWYFATEFGNAPLRVAPSGSVYHYGPSAAFPTENYRASNYWVDVVFTDTASGGQ